MISQDPVNFNKMNGVSWHHHVCNHIVSSHHTNSSNPTLISDLTSIINGFGEAPNVP